MRKTKKLPKFKSEEQEFNFWSKHDSTKFDLEFMKTHDLPELLRICSW